LWGLFLVLFIEAHVGIVVRGKRSRISVERDEEVAIFNFDAMNPLSFTL